jgi:hypothetical protein
LIPFARRAYLTLVTAAFARFADKLAGLDVVEPALDAAAG